MTGSDAATVQPFVGRVVLLVGASGEVLQDFAQRGLAGGARLAVALPRAAQVEAARQVTRFAAGEVLVGQVGAQDGEAAAGFVKGVEDALGPITDLIALGVQTGDGEVGHEAAGDLARLLEANLLAGANLVRAAVGRLRRRKRGRILFLGRAEADCAAANEAASQGALRAYAQKLADELAGSGVVVRVRLARGEVAAADVVVAELFDLLRDP